MRRENPRAVQFQTIYFSPDETQIGLSRRAEIKEGLLSRKLNKVFLYYSHAQKREDGISRVPQLCMYFLIEAIITPVDYVEGGSYLTRNIPWRTPSARRYLCKRDNFLACPAGREREREREIVTTRFPSPSAIWRSVRRVSGSLLYDAIL